MTAPAAAEVPVGPWRAQKVLIVCADVSGRPSPWSDGGVADLAGELVEAGVAVTVVCGEGFGQEAGAAALQAAGVEVATGPADWAAWSESRACTFSHVIVTDGGLAAGMAGPVLASQPQAAKVVWTANLAFRAVEATLPLTPHRERPGHEFARAAVTAHAGDVLERFDRIWTASPADQRYLEGFLGPGRRPALLARPVRRLYGWEAGFDRRRGLAVVAWPGADLIAGHEDAAVAAVEEVFARLVGRYPALTITVVSGRPTPRLARVADRPGVELADGIETLRRARVVLAPYSHGLGASAAEWAACCAGTPVLTSAGDPADLVVPAARLLADVDHWEEVRASQVEAAHRQCGPGAFRATLRNELLALGILPAPPRRPEAASAGEMRWRPPVPWRTKTPRLRPRDPPGRVPTMAPPYLGDTDAYRLWCATRGPTPAVLGDLARELDHLTHRPTISVLTPVYNTDPDVLEAAIASVRGQIYPGWELCLADDKSTREETREVLREAAAADPRIKVVTNEGRSGISGATNAALAAAAGEYVTFLDHDDILKPHALAQVARWLDADPSLDIVYSDEDKLDEAGGLVWPFFKPDWSPNLLTATNFVCHLLVARTTLVTKVGGLRSGFDGSQDHDLVLRLTELTDRIGHIPEPLYSWRMVPGSAAAVADAKPYAFEAAKSALRESLARRRQEGTVEDGAITGVYRVRHAIPGRPRVAVLIPTRDRVDLVKRCIDSVRERTTYPNYEVVVIDNESRDQATLEFLATGPDRVVRYPAGFHYARMLNLAAAQSECDALLFLNNDTEVIGGDWLEALLEHGMRPEVGAVGGRLYLTDGRPQHEGIIVGSMGIATNVDHAGYRGLGEMTRDCSAVTGACVLIRPAVYWAVGGNDERLRVAYNDVDICLRIRQAGYQVVYTPYARLVHAEGASRAGYEHVEDGSWFQTRWRPDAEEDPFYNPNYSRRGLFRLAV